MIKNSRTFYNFIEQVENMIRQFGVSPMGALKTKKKYKIMIVHSRTFQIILQLHGTGCKHDGTDWGRHLTKIGGLQSTMVMGNPKRCKTLMWDLWFQRYNYFKENYTCQPNMGKKAKNGIKVRFGIGISSRQDINGGI